MCRINVNKAREILTWSKNQIKDVLSKAEFGEITMTPEMVANIENFLCTNIIPWLEMLEGVSGFADEVLPQAAIDHISVVIQEQQSLQAAPIAKVSLDTDAQAALKSLELVKTALEACHNVTDNNVYEKLSSIAVTIVDFVVKSINAHGALGLLSDYIDSAAVYIVNEIIDAANSSNL